jgi:hypothetical protein
MCRLPFALSVVKVAKNRLHRTPGGWYGSCSRSSVPAFWVIGGERERRRAGTK